MLFERVVRDSSGAAIMRRRGRLVVAVGRPSTGGDALAAMVITGTQMALPRCHSLDGAFSDNEQGHRRSIASADPNDYAQGKPYITFVNTPPRVEKYCPDHASREDRGGKEKHCEKCYRFQVHMHKFNTTTDLNSIPYLRRAINTGLQQKSSIQTRTAAEIAERRKSRKAYSTPAYSSNVQRTRVVRFQPPRSPDFTATLPPPEPAWQDQRGGDEEEVDGEAERIKAIQDEIAGCQQNEEKDEAEFSRQLGAIALDTPEIEYLEQHTEHECQITPDIKVDSETCPSAPAVSPVSESQPPEGGEVADARSVAATHAGGVNYRLPRHRPPRYRPPPAAGSTQTVVPADAVDMGLSQGIGSVTIQEQKNITGNDNSENALTNRLTDKQTRSDVTGGNKWKKAVAKNSYTSVYTDVEFSVADIISETAKLAKSYVRIVHLPVQGTRSRSTNILQGKTFSKSKAAKHPAATPKTVVKSAKSLKKPARPLSKQKSGKKTAVTQEVLEQQSEFDASLQPLPVSPPDELEKNSIETEPDPPLVPEPATQVSEDVTIQRVNRAPIKKRERVAAYQRAARDATPSTEPVMPATRSTPVSDWIFDSDGDTAGDAGHDKSCSVGACQPQLPTVAALPPAPTPGEKLVRAKRRLTALTLRPPDGRKRWGATTRDSSYLDALRSQERADQRRLRQQQMYERLHNRKRLKHADQEEEDCGANFDDYSFLAKYCIFNRSNLEMYRHAFNAIDEAHSGHLSGPDTMLALRVVNNKLTTSEEEYIYRILELVGYKVIDGADFKLFSVLAALSQKISSLDTWMKNFIGQVDFRILEMKTFMCKTLWECNVDRETSQIPIPQLLIDLRAGGVSFNHECEIQEKLAHLTALDLLDFLTYVPLFIMIHESVVDNPLDDSRDK